MALWPEEAAGMGWSSLEQVREFTGLPPESLIAVATPTGRLNDSIRNVVFLPPAVWKSAVAAARVQGEDDLRPLTPVEAAQAGLVWRIARRIVASRSGASWASFVDIDLWAPDTPAPAAATAALAPGALLRKIRMATVVDQGDDSEFAPADAQQITIWHQRYASLMGAPAPEEEEPASDQLQALNQRVYSMSVAPYVDHAVWGPYGRKATRANKFRTWIPTADGRYISKELPRPENFQQWQASWRVFVVQGHLVCFRRDRPPCCHAI